MSNFLGKLKEFVGIPAPDEFEEDYYVEDTAGSEYTDVYEPSIAMEQAEEPIRSQSRSFEMDGTKLGSQAVGTGASNVVGMPGASRFWGSATEVLVLEPRAFEEMPQVIQALRERKSVVLNLSLMEPAQAQRAVDFVAGATFTIDGHQERVGENIFLFTPSCVQVRTQSGVIHEAPQVTPATVPSRIATTSWQTDPVLNSLAQ